MTPFLLPHFYFSHASGSSTHCRRNHGASIGGIKVRNGVRSSRHSWLHCFARPTFHPSGQCFCAYSLAQKYRLRQEAAKAAKITLTFTLTIEELEKKDMLDVMPCSYLHELWKYHQSVQRHLLSNVDGFKGSAVMIGLACQAFNRESQDGLMTTLTP